MASTFTHAACGQQDYCPDTDYWFHDDNARSYCQLTEFAASLGQLRSCWGVSFSLCSNCKLGGTKIDLGVGAMRREAVTRAQSRLKAL